MATFEYNALTSAGRLMKGTIEAGTHQEADDLLKQMQLSINSVEEAKPEKPKTAIGRNEFLLFNQQLASITKAGIPLERGLRELAVDIRSLPMISDLHSLPSRVSFSLSADSPIICTISNLLSS